VKLLVAASNSGIPGEGGVDGEDGGRLSKFWSLPSEEEKRSRKGGQTEM